MAPASSQYSSQSSFCVTPTFCSSCLLYTSCYALPLVGALYLIVALHSLAPGIPWLALAAVEGLAAGVPLALLLCRWGRVLGEASIDQSVPEVFIGSALGAAVCFFVVAIPVEGAYILLYVLPVGSAWALRALGEPDDRDAEPAAADDPTEEAELLHAAVTTLQMDVAARRVAHRALPAS